MNNNEMVERYCEGRLPQMAPLANPYVPFQMENPPKYESKVAVIRGTLFPGLDLPFMGMINKNELPMTPLTELQTMAFILQELALYLDTHKDDAEALELYRNLQKMNQKAKMVYEEKYGPLTHLAHSNGEYNWLNGPWPWEYMKNQEAM